MQIHIHLDDQYKLFNQFKTVRRIGSSYIGKIWLVQNAQKQLYALTIVNKSTLNRNIYEKNYFDAEIQHLNQIKNKKITFNRTVNYYGMLEDEQNIGLLFQYCNGEDLQKFQAKLQGKVFPLQKATELLSQVLMALQELQELGHTHGNLNSQNILTINKDNQFVIKLNGFGYPNQILNLFEPYADVLKNECYTSPQSYSQFFNIKQSGQDIWSFGVLLYFMLNMDFPFKINPRFGYQKKLNQLKKRTLNFSYKTCVTKSKKQLLNNCNDQTQDFFKRVFQFDKQKRITLKQIKAHPLFARYFYKNQKINRIQKVYLNQKAQFNYENFIKLQEKLQMTQLQNQKLKKQNVCLKIQNQELKIKGEKTKQLSKQIKELLNQPN